MSLLLRCGVLFEVFRLLHMCVLIPKRDCHCLKSSRYLLEYLDFKIIRLDLPLVRSAENIQKDAADKAVV